MSYPHTLGLGEALRVSGVKGGEIPRIAPGLQPVMVLADFSRSYSAEPFEARGFSGKQESIAGTTDRLWIRFHSRGRGGMVLEDVRITGNASGFGTAFMFIDMLTDPPPGATETQLVVVDSGGTPSVSRVFQGTTSAAPSGAGPIDFSGLLVGAQPLGYAARFFIPPGRHLCFFGRDTVGAGGGNLQTSFSWREIPEPIGPP